MAENTIDWVLLVVPGRLCGGETELAWRIMEVDCECIILLDAVANPVALPGLPGRFVALLFLPLLLGAPVAPAPTCFVGLPVAGFNRLILPKTLSMNLSSTVFSAALFSQGFDDTSLPWVAAVPSICAAVGKVIS